MKTHEPKVKKEEPRFQNTSMQYQQLDYGTNQPFGAAKFKKEF